MAKRMSIRAFENAYGIKDTKEVLILAASFVGVFLVTSLKDFPRLFGNIFALLPKFQPAVEGIKNVRLELGDLAENEERELLDVLKSELGLKDIRIEALYVILALGLRIASVVSVFRAIKKGVSADKELAALAA